MTSWWSAPRRVAGLLAVVGLLVWSGCSVEGRPDPNDRLDVPTYEVVDADGRQVVLEGPARRVVSLVPSASETLHALGRSDALVGRTDFDTASWASPIPSVGGGLEPSLEAIVALAPDLVIRFGGEQDTRTPARLDDLGIAHMAVRPDDIEDIYRTIDLVGWAVGAGARTDSLEAAVRSGLEEAAARVSGLPRVRAAFVLDGSPPWVAGPGTFIDEVMALMGGDNAFGDLEALYAPVSPEQLRQRSIDVVLLGGTGPFDASLVPGARIERAGAALDLPGPGVVGAARRIGELLHGRAHE
ncbi:MAG: ABC transporter substrate-binding protein [Gemmatimonadales bacterium]